MVPKRISQPSTVLFAMMAILHYDMTRPTRSYGALNALRLEALQRNNEPTGIFNQRVGRLLHHKRTIAPVAADLTLNIPWTLLKSGAMAIYLVVRLILMSTVDGCEIHFAPL